MPVKLQYKCCLILLAIGIVIAVLTIKTVWSLFGLMLIGGSIILFFVFFEQRWIKREYLKIGLIASIVLAIAYGILEYIFFDATWNNWLKISDWFVAVFGDKYYYWGFMTLLNFTIVFIFSRRSLALSLASIPLFAVNEDLWYWITKSIHEGHYVFPVGNWFDTRFPFLQGLGEPIPIFPEWPRFYFVGWILVSILIVIQLKNLQGRKFLIGLSVFVAASALCLLFALI